MVRIGLDVSPDEYIQLMDVKRDLTWRELFLEALGIEPTPLKIGRPRENPDEYIGRRVGRG